MTNSREVERKGRGCQRNIQILGAQMSCFKKNNPNSPGIIIDFTINYN